MCVRSVPLKVCEPSASLFPFFVLVCVYLFWDDVLCVCHNEFKAQTYIWLDARSVKVGSRRQKGLLLLTVGEGHPLLRDDDWTPGLKGSWREIEENSELAQMNSLFFQESFSGSQHSSWAIINSIASSSSTNNYRISLQRYNDLHPLLFPHPFLFTDSFRILPSLDFSDHPIPAKIKKRERERSRRRRKGHKRVFPHQSSSLLNIVCHSNRVFLSRPLFSIPVTRFTSCL